MDSRPHQDTRWSFRRCWLGWSLLLVVSAGCAGHRIAPQPSPAYVGFEQVGNASWYGHPYHGRRASSGEVYDMNRLTAAHPTLPLGTRVVVTNLRNGRSVELRVNDRGPFPRGRIIDLSYAAARRLDAVGAGVIPVRVRVVALPADTPRSDDGFSRRSTDSRVVPAAR